MNYNYNQTLAKLIQESIRYDAGDARRIQHFIKVHNFARQIAISEGIEDEQLFILEAAAILHDIGIHAAESKYGNCSGKHQEELGPSEALKVIAATGGFSATQTERVCWLIAHHHTYSNIISQDHRILIEADFLVNSFEDNLSIESILAFRKKIFHTPSAIRMLNDMWNL